MELVKVYLDSPIQRVDVLQQGPPGSAGLQPYIHTQSVAASEWIVNHNLDRYPSTEIRSTGGAVVIAEVINVSFNQLRVYFSSPFAGTAYCL